MNRLYFVKRNSVDPSKIGTTKGYKIDVVKKKKLCAIFNEKKIKIQIILDIENVRFLHVLRFDNSALLRLFTKYNNFLLVC